MSETIYAIRRADGEPMFGEFSFATTTGPDDWDPATDDSDGAEDGTVYELVEMPVKVLGTKTLPTCKDCPRKYPQPAEFWGLCETHAREDDPQYFASDHGPLASQEPS